jgi:hypothetical protein
LEIVDIKIFFLDFAPSGRWAFSDVETTPRRKTSFFGSVFQQIESRQANKNLHIAERVGFEPTVARKATTVFETVPFNRSGTSPNSGAYYIPNLNAWL